MGVAYGRYAPFGYSHPAEKNCLYGNRQSYIQITGGVKIRLSQGVIFRLTFRFLGTILTCYRNQKVIESPNRG